MRSTIHRLGLGLSLAILACGSSAAMAQTYYSGGGTQGRTGTWEFFGDLRLLFGTTFDSHGSTIKTNDDLGFGIGGAYNFDEHFQMGFEFNFNSLGYNATIASANNPPQQPWQATGTAEVS